MGSVLTAYGELASAKLTAQSSRRGLTVSYTAFADTAPIFTSQLARLIALLGLQRIPTSTHSGTNRTHIASDGNSDSVNDVSTVCISPQSACSIAFPSALAATVDSIHTRVYGMPFLELTVVASEVEGSLDLQSKRELLSFVAPTDEALGTLRWAGLRLKPVKTNSTTSGGAVDATAAATDSPPPAGRGPFSSPPTAADVARLARAVAAAGALVEVYVHGAATVAEARGYGEKLSRALQVAGGAGPEWFLIANSAASAAATVNAPATSASTPASHSATTRAPNTGSDAGSTRAANTNMSSDSIGDTEDDNDDESESEKAQRHAAAVIALLAGPPLQLGGLTSSTGGGLTYMQCAQMPHPQRLKRPAETALLTVIPEKPIWVAINTTFSRNNENINNNVETDTETDSDVSSDDNGETTLSSDLAAIAHRNMNTLATTVNGPASVPVTVRTQARGYHTRYRAATYIVEDPNSAMLLSLQTAPPLTPREDDMLSRSLGLDDEEVVPASGSGSVEATAAVALAKAQAAAQGSLSDREQQQRAAVSETVYNSALGRHVMTEIFLDIVKERCFHTLRTEQQLGYVVICATGAAGGPKTFAIVIQVRDPKLKQKILRSYVI